MFYLFKNEKFGKKFINFFIFLHFDPNFENSYKTKVFLSKITGLSMNQIQNWFINSRKRFLGPLKVDIEKDDDSRNLDSVHQSLPIINRNNSLVPTLMLQQSQQTPQQQQPAIFCPKPVTHHNGANRSLMPHMVHYDEKDPTIALNIPEENSDEKQDAARLLQKNQGDMLAQMNQLQRMWIKSNPIFSYYNQMIMNQLNGTAGANPSVSSLGSFGPKFVMAPNGQRIMVGDPNEYIPPKMRTDHQIQRNREMMNQLMEQAENDLGN